MSEPHMFNRTQVAAIVEPLEAEIKALEFRLDLANGHLEMQEGHGRDLELEIMALKSRLNSATKLIKKVWEYDVVTEGGLLPQDLELEIEAFVIPAVVEKHVHKYENAGACQACECGAVLVPRDLLKGTGVLSE